MEEDDELETSDHGCYTGMLRTLRRFGEGGASLKESIDELQPLIDRLRLVDPDWKDQFSGLLAELQHIFDECVERQSLLTNEEYQLVKAIAQDMQGMVMDVLDWSADERRAIKLIVEARRPDITPDLDAGFASGFSAVQAKGIYDALREEAAENRFLVGKRDDWGELLEEFIGRMEPPAGE